jgi:succinate dehydrogenase / fumarate reductase, cytochrome b subunit
MASPSLGVARPAGWIRRFYGSVIGKKVVMAVTGAVLVGFLVVHMAGNLLAFQGPAALNDYSAFLKSSLPVLWGARLVLLASAVLHIHAALALTVLARGARPAPYARLRPRASTVASRLMRAGGVLLAAFIVFHLLHFTTGTLHPDFAGHDVYRNVVTGFQSRPVALFYLVALVALAFHIQHGVWSLFQTLGLNHPHVNGVRRGLARALAVALGLGFAAIPVAVLAGLLQ